MFRIGALLILIFSACGNESRNVIISHETRDSLPENALGAYRLKSLTIDGQSVRIIGKLQITSDWFSSTIKINRSFTVIEGRYEINGLFLIVVNKNSVAIKTYKYFIGNQILRLEHVVTGQLHIMTYKKFPDTNWPVVQG